MAQTDIIRSEFIEKVGQIAQGEGMPRIAGRVLGLLIFDGEPMPFGQIADELGVSRGSVSSSVRLLEDRGVIKRIGMPQQRQDFFQLSDQPFTGLIELALKRIGRAEQEINASLDQLPAEADAIRSRLGSYSGFYKALGTGLQHALATAEDTKG